MLFLVPARFLADVKQFDPFPPVAGAPFPNPGWHEQGKELNNQVSHDACAARGVAQAWGVYTLVWSLFRLCIFRPRATAGTRTRTRTRLPRSGRPSPRST